MKIEQNISRLDHLLTLYKMSADDLLEMISHGLKKPLAKEDIFSTQIEVAHLKRIDKIFNKGLHYYLDPTTPSRSQASSIFFRKSTFNSDLNIGAIKIVNHFEEFKISLSAIAKLADLNISRTIPLYNLNNDPQKVAVELRDRLYPTFTSDKKEFLKAIITKLAQNNILVFEFVETWNKREKANIDGFFLNPNVIVLKRNQISMRREIFTLAHELGHFILNEEEIEKLEDQSLGERNLSTIERWCNDFAYFFLIGEWGRYIDDIEMTNVANDYHADLIKIISDNTHLSQLALYTRLLYLRKISKHDYEKIQHHFDEIFLAAEEEKKRAKEEDKRLGIERTGRAPVPIQSPLLISTIQTAFYEGVITEYEVCKSLNIKPEKFTELIS